MFSAVDGRVGVFLCDGATASHTILMTDDSAWLFLLIGDLLKAQRLAELWHLRHCSLLQVLREQATVAPRPARCYARSPSQNRHAPRSHWQLTSYATACQGEERRRRDPPAEARTLTDS